MDFGAKYDINQYLEIGQWPRPVWRIHGATVPYQISIPGGLSQGLNPAADAKMEKDEDPYFCFGAEYWTSIGEIRGGFQAVCRLRERAKFMGGNAFTLQTITAGLQLRLLSAGTGIKLRNFQLDYVFRYNNHGFSVMTTFCPSS